MNLMLKRIDAMKGTTARGELTIKSEAGDGQLLISVSDTGVGLPWSRRNRSSRHSLRPRTAGLVWGCPSVGQLLSRMEGAGGQWRLQERCNFSVHPADHARGARITFSAARLCLAKFGVKTKVTRPFIRPVLTSIAHVLTRVGAAFHQIAAGVSSLSLMRQENVTGNWKQTEERVRPPPSWEAKKNDNKVLGILWASFTGSS
jgi:hypothetical protein